jgi:hypothetical protein
MPETIINAELELELFETLPIEAMPEITINVELELELFETLPIKVDSHALRMQFEIKLQVR